MRREDLKDLLPLRSMTQKQRCKLYKSMANMIVNELDKPVRYAIRASLIMFVSLLFLPHHPLSILIAFGIGLIGGIFL